MLNTNQSPVLSLHHKMQVLLYHTLTPQDMIYSYKPVDPGPQRASTQQQVNEHTESSGERERVRERDGGEEEEIWKTKELKANPSNLIKYSK